MNLGDTAEEWKSRAEEERRPRVRASLRGWLLGYPRLCPAGNSETAWDWLTYPPNVGVRKLGYLSSTSCWPYRGQLRGPQRPVRLRQGIKRKLQVESDWWLGCGRGRGCGPVATELILPL